VAFTTLNTLPLFCTRNIHYSSSGLRGKFVSHVLTFDTLEGFLFIQLHLTFSAIYT